MASAGDNVCMLHTVRGVAEGGHGGRWRNARSPDGVMSARSSNVSATYSTGKGALQAS